MTNSNYPDDIRDYDHDPRSPFYEGPQDEEEADALKEAEEMAGDAEYDRRRDEET